MGRPLDRTRPLWELHVVEGLDGGHVAAITKLHHAAIDGISGLELTANLLDLERDPAPVAPPDLPWTPDTLPAPLTLLGEGLAALAGQPLAAVRAVGRSAGAAVRVWRNNRRPGAAGPPAPFAG